MPAGAGRARIAPMNAPCPHASRAAPAARAGAPAARAGAEDAEAAALRRLTRMAQLLDARFRVPGTSLRFGFDGLLGLVPGLGDAIALLLSGYIFAEAVRLGVRPATLAAMAFNTALDALLGAIPVVGDVFDFAYKSNLRNARLVMRDLERRRDTPNR